MGRTYLILLLGLASLCTNVHAVGWEVITELDRYVQAEDPNYSYTIVNSCNYSEDQTAVYILNVTSQQWLDETFSDRSIWWHQLFVAIPWEVRHPEHAFYFIAGGSNRNPDSIQGCEDSTLELLAALAQDTGTVGGFIKQVPNQPILMSGDPYQESRTEDNWISWTWAQYIYHNTDGQIPPEILARFPMTKAAKAGMDATADVVRDLTGLTVDKFMIAGASKRGWTTWSLAATDRRVVAAMPLVFTLVNFTSTMQKHFRSLGGYTWALVDYYTNNITRILADPEKVALITPHEDMYSYIERFADFPMLNVLGTGDQFFQPDDSHYWLPAMTGWSNMMMVPNAGHTLAPTYPRIYESFVALTQFVIRGHKLPDISYTGTNDDTSGTVTLNVVNLPSQVELLNVEAHAGESNNDTSRGIMRRDWRVMDPIPTSVWFDPYPVEDLGGNSYRFTVEKVEEKFIGSFIEAQFSALEGDFKLWLTTEFHSTPDTFPYPPCETDEECHGELV